MILIRGKALVVADEAMQKTLDLAVRAARTHLPVLIVGPSGTGKEMIARYIHYLSPRSSQPFVAINCSAIPETLMEAELFGYERGSFTGAIQQRVGKFEKATEGTLLLDEVSEMPTHLQAKLLRVLQEGEIDRIGGKDIISIGTRIIATTNKDPWSLVESGVFREDLFYRLNVIRINCAALCGRTDAIQALANVFLKRACENQGVAQKTLGAEAVSMLLAYSWPGNVRELENAIERAVLVSDERTLNVQHFEGLNAPREFNSETLSDLEQQHILLKLSEHNGNRTHAAKALGISVRTLRNKLREYRA